MGITSLQVCMDASDLLQGTMSSDDCGLDFSSSPTSAGAADHHMLACSRAAPMMERRLRPPHDQALKCPRCESTHTKFCYYNNYSLSQPRYFCKTCRRYWTKGGTLRNIPVGGGCRKNKKSSSSSSKKSTSSSSNDVVPTANSTSIMVPNHHHHHHHLIGNNTNPLGLGSSSSTSPHGATDLQLAFPELQFSPLISSLMMGAQGGGGAIGGTNFLDAKYNALLENIHSNGGSMGGLRPIDFMDSKFDPLVGHAATTTRTHHGHDDDHHHNMISSRLMGGGGGLDFSIMGGGGAGTGGLGDVGLHDHHHQHQHQHQHQQHGGLTTTTANFNPYGAAASHIEGTGININPSVMMDSCQRLMMPTYDHHHHHQTAAAASSVDVKPSANKLLSLEWQQQQDHHHQQGGGVGVGGSHVSNVIGLSSSWAGNNMLSGYGPSATNPLV